MMAARTTTSEPVYHDWEAILDQRIDLLKEASIKGDGQLVAALQVQDRLSEVDHVATLFKEAKALGPGALDDSHSVMRALENHAENATRDVKSDGERVKKDMEALAESPDGADPDDWERELDRNIDTMKKRSEDRWEDLRTFGKRRIRDLPRPLQPTAARAYGGGLNAVSVFVNNAVQWLMGAVDTIAQWFQGAWAKIKEWAVATKNWFEAAVATVRGWFGGRSSAAARARSPRMSSVMFPPHMAEDFPDLESVTSKMEKVGLDKFVLVKEDNNWVVQLAV